MKRSRGRLSWLLLAAAFTLSSCGEQVLVRLHTEVFHDGSLERRLEVVGRGDVRLDLGRQRTLVVKRPARRRVHQ